MLKDLKAVPLPTAQGGFYFYADVAHLLKPGAFARFQIVLGSADADFIVPSAAVTRRKDRDVVFLVADGSQTATMRPVQIGLVEGDRVQITPADGGPLSGNVIVLGHQLLDDGSAVRVVEDDRSESREREAEPGG